MMDRFKPRVYRILTDPADDDILGQIIHVFILVLIAVNVVVGILETITSLHASYQQFFYWFEFGSVMVFTVEYLLRLWSCTSQAAYQHPIRGRWKLAKQPMSVIDLLAIAPFYLQTILVGVDLRFIRILRLFRLLRLFRMGRLLRSFVMLGHVFRRKKEELYIACIILLVVVVFAASLMYLVEGKVPDTKFTSIPASMWWAMITITTIGYGDMYPVTPLGQTLGAFIAFLGVCVFALPVAILGSGFIEAVDPKYQIHPTETPQDASEDTTTSPSSSSSSDATNDTASLHHAGDSEHSDPDYAPHDSATVVPLPPPFGLALHVPTSPPTTPPPSPSLTLADLDAAVLDAIAERVAHKLQDSLTHPVADQIAQQIADQVVDEIANRVLRKLQPKPPADHS